MNHDIIYISELLIYGEIEMKKINYLIPIEIFMFVCHFFPMYKIITKLPSEGAVTIYEEITKYTGFEAIFNLRFFLIGNIFMAIVFLSAVVMLVMQIISILKRKNILKPIIILSYIQLLFGVLLIGFLYLTVLTYIFCALVLIHFILAILFTIYNEKLTTV